MSKKVWAAIGIVLVVVSAALSWYYWPEVQRGASEWFDYVSRLFAKGEEEKPALVPEVQQLASPEAKPVATEPKQEPLVSAPSRPEWHQVVKGETLGGIAKQYGLDWRSLCLHNHLPDCHDIKPEQMLNLLVADDVIERAKRSPEKMFVPKYRYAYVDCRRTKLGYCVFEKVGGDPVCGKDWAGILRRDFNVLKEDAVAWSGAPKERMFVKGGSFVDGLSFGHGYWDGPVLVKHDLWAEVGEIGGKRVGQFEACCNFFLVPPKPTVEQPPVPQEEVVVPPPPEKEEPTPTPTPEPEPEARRVSCPIDVKNVIGQEFNPSHGGNKSRVTFLSAGLLCKFRGEGGWHSLGGGVDASWWQGLVNSGTGEYKGQLVTVSPAYEWVDDKGWKVEVRLPAIGRFHSKYEEGQYFERTSATAVGVNWSGSDYRRRLHKETWWPEWQVFGGAFLLTDAEIFRSWAGQTLTNDSVKTPKFLVNLHFRGWIYEDPKRKDLPLPYVQAGVSLTEPGISAFANTRVGVSDPERICGIGIGLDFDLKNGGEALGYGWWCDGAKAVSAIREASREEQIVVEYNPPQEPTVGEDKETPGLVAEEPPGNPPDLDQEQEHHSG